MVRIYTLDSVPEVGLGAVLLLLRSWQKREFLPFQVLDNDEETKKNGFLAPYNQVRTLKVFSCRINGLMVRFSG